MSVKFMNIGLYVSKSRVSGLGVFSTRTISKGETVEIAPILKLGNPDYVLEDYVFSNNRLCLGYGALYNHHNEPNIRQKCDDISCVFSALKDIQAGEELYIDYGQEWWRAKQMIPISPRPVDDN